LKGHTFLEDLLASPSPIVLDGAMGTMLQQRIKKVDHPLMSAMALLDEPDTVTQLHAEYIAAGADIIRLNTFSTAEVCLRSGGLGAYRDELPEIAFEVAEKAVLESGRENVVLAATLCPLSSYFKNGNPSQEELQIAQEEHATRLALSGVEVAICETMPSVKEAVAAIKAAQSSGMEAIVSFVPGDPRHILSGETLDTAVRSVIPLSPLAICLNCAEAETIEGGLATLMSITQVAAGAYASVNLSHQSRVYEDHLKISVVRYMRFARAWASKGVRIVGGCCGTTPEHIKLIREKVDKDAQEAS